MIKRRTETEKMDWRLTRGHADAHVADEGEEPCEARNWTPDDAVGIPCAKYLRQTRGEGSKER